MTAAGKIPKLADPNSLAVRTALRRECPKCHAQPGQRCLALHFRIVHNARVDFRPNPPGSKTGTGLA